MDWAPIPSLEVCFGKEDIMKQQQLFDEAWRNASVDVDVFANTMDDWDMFGTGELMKKWVDIGLQKRVNAALRLGAAGCCCQ
jgi:hypothetical protein